MAASASTMNANQMERLTTCPICLDKFRIPKLLPCMHTFCLTPCLTSLVDPRARSLKCPECRREHTIPAGSSNIFYSEQSISRSIFFIVSIGGVQAFPANLTMIGFLDLQPSNAIERADRCAICQQQKPSDFLLTDDKNLSILSFLFFVWVQHWLNVMIVRNLCVLNVVNHIYVKHSIKSVHLSVSYVEHYLNLVRKLHLMNNVSMRFALRMN